MNPHAVFFDIDGTLWDRYNFIPDSTRQAIKKLKANGHLAFINTGRTRGYVTNPDLLSLGFDGIVCGCGTMVEYKGDIIFLHEIDNELLANMISLMRDFGMKPIIEGKKYLYMEEADFIDDPYGKKLMSELKDARRSIDECWGKWNGSKVSCEMDGCDYERCFSILSNDFDALVHNPHVAEIVPCGFTKGTGIKKVCEYLGIDLEDTVAIGDSVNDIEMLKTAGKSVAMGSGSDDAKNIATYVTTPLLEDGIYNALVHLGLIE